MVRDSNEPNDALFVESAQLFPLINELLIMGKTVQIRVRGNSMHPFMRSDLDNITLQRATFDMIRKRDIVLIKRRDGAYVLHRVCRVDKGSFYMIGDAQQAVEGPLYPEQLIAKGVSIIRSGRELRCDSGRMRLAVWAWMAAHPIRPFIFKIYGMYVKLRRVLR